MLWEVVVVASVLLQVVVARLQQVVVLRLRLKEVEVDMMVVVLAMIRWVVVTVVMHLACLANMRDLPSFGVLWIFFCFLNIV
jgi:hypothetical protein